jgi:hypothetical protein
MDDCIHEDLAHRLGRVIEGDGFRKIGALDRPFFGDLKGESAEVAQDVDQVAHEPSLLEHFVGLRVTRILDILHVSAGEERKGILTEQQYSGVRGMAELEIVEPE